MLTRGVLYVSYGEAALQQLGVALHHLRGIHNWSVAVISDEDLSLYRRHFVFDQIHYASTHMGARDAKLEMDRLSPFTDTIYLDVDTRIRGSISTIWDILADGWEMAQVPTGSKTHTGAMRHIFLDGETIMPEGLEERNATVAECGWPLCGWQGGVMAFRKTERVHRFFDAWREEWRRWGDQDQAALARAYRRCPVSIFPLGQDFNGGGLVGHYHSMARRRGLRGSIAL